jgi:hypothetical protein
VRLAKAVLILAAVGFSGAIQAKTVGQEIGECNRGHAGPQKKSTVKQTSDGSTPSGPSAKVLQCYVKIIPSLEKGLNDSSRLHHPHNKLYIANILLLAYQASGNDAKVAALIVRRDAYAEAVRLTESLPYGESQQAQIDYYSALGKEYAGDVKAAQQRLKVNNRVEAAGDGDDTPYGWAAGPAAVAQQGQAAAAQTAAATQAAEQRASAQQLAQQQ